MTWFCPSLSSVQDDAESHVNGIRVCHFLLWGALGSGRASPCLVPVLDSIKSCELVHLPSERKDTSGYCILHQKVSVLLVTRQKKHSAVIY